MAEDHDCLNDGAAATLVEESPSPKPTDCEAQGPRCEKCGFASDATACPSCGWYPMLGIHVEVDQNFEAVMNARRASEESTEEPEPQAPKAEWQKHVEVWKDLIPLWGWLLIGTTLGVIAAAIAVRIVTIPSPTMQMWCGVGGLIGGLVLTLVVHLVAFVLCSSDDADLGVADLVVKPFKSWKRVVSDLPNRLWLANGANLGLSTAICAALIVGGIPYERLLDWGYKQPPKKNMIAAIAQMAAENGREVKDLDDAIRELGHQAGVDKLKEAATGKPVENGSEEPRQKTEALIVGYRVDREERLSELLVAAERQGKMKYVGRVKPDLDEDEAQELLESFQEHVSGRPFVKTGTSGIWLRPRFTCSVSFTSWPNGMRPKKLAWDKLLGEIEL